MSYTYYQILHVLSVLILTGFTFYAFAAPAETRKKVMIITGIASLVVFVTGFGLITKLLGAGSGMWPLWAILKLVAWLGLSALAGLGYRRRAKVPVFMAVACGLIFMAIYSVYTKFGV